MATTSKKNPVDTIFSFVTGAASFTVIVLIVAILYELVHESAPAIARFGIWKFLSSTDWNPVKESFGALTNIYGTILTTVLSLLMAIPVAIGIAVFVTEISPNFLKGPIGVAIELLAAIPSIIYGMWGLFTLSPIMSGYVEPFLKAIFEDVPVVGILFQGTPMGIDILTASIILSIMIIPFTASISRDSFNLTPAVVKESAYALGTTRWEVVRDIVIPYSKLGVFGGVVLTLANEFAEADNDIYLSSLFYLALVLFVMSFITLAIAKFFLLKAERKYSR